MTQGTRSNVTDKARAASKTTTLSWRAFEKLMREEGQRLEFVTLLTRYMNAYPAFRMKPVGAPGSEKRIEQENLMALEDAARALLAKVRA